MSVIKRYLFWIWTPLSQRFALGEGLLLAINISLLVLLDISFVRAVLLVGVSLVLVANLYLYNDLIDRKIDRDNPKKDWRLVEELNAYHKEAQVFSWVILLSLAGSASLLGDHTLYSLLCAWVVNMFYSHAGKRMPVMDLLVVGLWGAAIAGMVTQKPALIVLVGLLTVVAHAIQIRMDVQVDCRTDQRTSQVFSPLLTSWMIGLAGLLAVLLVWSWVGMYSLLFCVPAVVMRAGPQRPWQIIVAKLAMGIGWLVVLAGV